jgi:hypothetical protein
MQDLARKLFALEAKECGQSDSSVDVTLRVCEKLRLSLLQFAGVIGFSSLLSRALTLACLDIPILKSVHVDTDGSLEGFSSIEKLVESVDIGSASHPGVAFVSQLLSLLVTFIGFSIVMSLLRDAWPSEPFGLAEQEAEE